MPTPEEPLFLPQVTDPPLQAENAELKERVNFLIKTNEGLEGEVNELRQVLFNNEVVFNDLIKSFTNLEKTAVKDSKVYETKMQQQKQQIQQLQERNKKILAPRVMKPYHELAESQRTKEHKRIRDHVNSELEPHLKKRNLGVKEIVLEHAEGIEKDITINAHPPRTYPNLTAAEKEVVSRVSDLKVINRQSDAGYAAINSVSHVLPPLAHIKPHDAEIILPEIEVAPGRSGGFCSLQGEIKTQIEHQNIVEDLSPRDELSIKLGIDGTRLVRNVSVCVYSVAVIWSKSSSIGIVGAVTGNDAYEDMMLCAKPFFTQVVAIATNPQVQTSAGLFKFKVKIGGDMSNLLELFGLSKACSSFPLLLLHPPQVPVLPHPISPKSRPRLQPLSFGAHKGWNHRGVEEVRS